MSDRIGQTIWRFDINRRVYRPGGYKGGSGGPIWREHWEPLKVIGETSRSWLVGHEYSFHRIPKKGPLPHGWSWSEEEIDKLAWCHDHRHEIARLIQASKDFDVLMQIAKLIGYKP